MSGSLRLNGSTSGFSEITAPDVAGDQTFTLPAVGGTLSTVVYQQGNYTPAPLLGTCTSIADRCFWVRVGNKITINGSATDISNTTSGDPFQLVQLPYPCSVESYGSAMATRIATTISSASCQVSASYVTPDSEITFYVNSPAPGNSAKVIVHSDVDSNTASTVYWNLTYLTDDTTFVPINGATIS